MAISFNEDSVFNLKQIPIEHVRDDVTKLLIGGEDIIMAFQTVRDQLVFTNKRIISIDLQKITGKRRTYTSMPYSRIQYFSIEPPALIEIFPDSRLSVVFTDGVNAIFEFRGRTDISKIRRAISEYICK